jgi:uncharacterized membrane protein YfcA
MCQCPAQAPLSQRRLDGGESKELEHRGHLEPRTVTISTVLVIVAAMGVGAFVKGVTGQGLPSIAIPVMATFIGVEAAVVIMAIPGIVTNSWLIWTHRTHFPHTRDLATLLATGTVGAVVGTFLLERLNENVLALTLAAIVVVYAVVYFVHPELRLPERITRLTSPPVGLAAGLLQGATGISGPLIATYLHGLRLDKEAYVLSITTAFQVYAVVQALTLALVGLYTGDRLVLSLLSLLPIMAILPLGARLTGRLSRKSFEHVVLALLLVLALKLLYDGLG